MMRNAGHKNKWGADKTKNLCFIYVRLVILMKVRYSYIYDETTYNLYPFIYIYTCTLYMYYYNQEFIV